MTPMNSQPPPSSPAKKAIPVIAIILGGFALCIVPIIGILAAIAIPNFIRFQARSKQSECKVNLKSAFIAQKSYMGEKDAYGQTGEEIGFKPDARSRYLYVISSDSTIPPSLPNSPSESTLIAGIPSDLLDTVGVTGECPECEAVVICAGNVDNDATVDVWSVSTANRTVNGESVMAGQPFNHVSDITD